MVTLIGGAILVAAVALLIVRQMQAGKLSAITGTETSTVEQLTQMAQSTGRAGSAGLQQHVEVKGTIRSGEPLTSEIGERECVYYKSEVIREYEEREYNSNEKRWETRRTSDTVSSNERRSLFWVEDDTGKVLVDPTGASVDAVKVVDRFEQGLGTDGQISLGRFSINIGSGDDRTLGYRYRESILELGQPVYVLGEAVTVSGQLRIQQSGSSGKRFIISHKSEEALVGSTHKTIMLLTAGAIACAVIGVALVVAGLLRIV